MRAEQREQLRLQSRRELAVQAFSLRGARASWTRHSSSRSSSASSFKRSSSSLSPAYALFGCPKRPVLTVRQILAEPRQRQHGDVGKQKRKSTTFA